MDNFQIETAQNVSIKQKTAGIGERILAFLVDLAIIIAYQIIAALSLNALSHLGMEDWVYMMVMGLPMFLYYLLWETFWDGRTPGKAVLKLRVVKLDGSNPTFAAFLIRWLLRFVDITLTSGGIAVVSILFSGKGQRLGDLAAGTTVISEKSTTQFRETLLVQVPEDYIPKYPQVSLFNDQEIQNIKQIFTEAKAESNYQIIISLSKKVAAILEVSPEERPADFINTVLLDYNYYTQQS